MQGLLLINKPAGPTSHDIVDLVRKVTGERRVGHAGTLDPFAEGLLIILIGRQATRRQSEFLTLKKTYEAVIRLGAITDSADSTGRIKDVYYGALPAREKILRVLKSFQGTFWQTPPAFSAKKVRGKKAYELARRGEAVILAPQKVTIYELTLLDYRPPHLKIIVTVSAGTYIRSLAADIGERLGTGAYVEKLVRTSVEEFKLKDAIAPKNLNSKTVKAALEANYRRLNKKGLINLSPKDGLQKNST